MEDLSKGQFERRLEGIQRARKIFDNLTEGNINKSYIAYREILDRQVKQPEEDLRHESLLQGTRAVRRDPVHICPLCSNELRCRILPSKGRENLYGRLTYWYCSWCIWDKLSDKTREEGPPEYVLPEHKMEKLSNDTHKEPT